MIDPAKIQSYFSLICETTQRAGQHFSERPTVKRGLSIIYDFLERESLVKPGDRLLDIGLGGGQACNVFTDRFAAEYWGISIDPSEVSDARVRGRKADLADAHNLPFEDTSFDIVWASHVLEHCAAPLIVLYEWQRVLKDEGRILLWGPVGRDFKGKDDGTCVYGCRDHLITPTEWQYRWLFELSRLQVEHALDVPYQIQNEDQQRAYDRRKRLRGLLARFGLTLLPCYDVPNAIFFVLKHR